MLSKRVGILGVTLSTTNFCTHFDIGGYKTSKIGYNDSVARR